MKSINRFIRTTLAGGILFMIPLVIVVAVVRKALDILQVITVPLDEALDGEIIWGLDGRNLVGIGLLVLFCFLGGLLFRLAKVQASIDRLEENFLSYIPGYMLLKSLADDALTETKVHAMVPVLVKDDEAYNPGFLIEEKNGMGMVFLPEAPQANTGEIKIVPIDIVIRISISSTAMIHMIRNMGRGIIDYIPK